MKKTWRKALRRLIDEDNARCARVWPEAYRRLTPAELQRLTAQAWAEVGPKLQAVPVRLACHTNLLPPSHGVRRHQWSHAVQAWIIEYR